MFHQHRDVVDVLPKEDVGVAPDDEMYELFPPTWDLELMLMRYPTVQCQKTLPAHFPGSMRQVSILKVARVIQIIQAEQPKIFPTI